MLHGRAALVIETEFIIALNVQLLLESLGAAEVFLEHDAAGAREKLRGEIPIGIVVIGLDAGKADRLGMVRECLAAGIPVVCMTADFALGHGVPEFAGTPVLVKPVPDEDFVAAVETVLANKSG